MWLDRLKQMKKISGKTSQQISDETSIPKSTIDKLFSGQTKEPYLSSTKAIVHCMGFTLDDLEDISLLHTNYNKEESTLISEFRKLNSKGKEMLLDYVDFLNSNDKYVEIEQKEKHA